MQKRIFVGLGNPGGSYHNTRHNAGFLYLDFLAAASGVHMDMQWRNEKKFFAHYIEIVRNDEKWFFVKPETFMNDSGKAVGAFMKWHDIATSHLTVIHDDLDISFGAFKIQKSKGPKIHNGILSVEEYTHSKDFLRVRIGINHRGTGDEVQSETEHVMTGSGYVLSVFSKDELQEFSKVIFPAITDRLLLEI